MTLARRLAAASDVVLRDERIDDQQFVADLYAETRRTELLPVPWNETQKHFFLRSQFALQRDYYRQHYEAAEFLVMVEGDTPIGRIYLHQGRDEIRLMEIALIQQRQGFGIGTRLISALCQLANDDNCELTLHVERDNPAVRLYQRLGFTLREERGVNLFLGRLPTASPPTTI